MSGTGSAAASGVELDMKTLSARITPKGLARLTGALRWALSRRRLAGRSWEVLVGHITFCLLLRRPALSALYTIHRFIRSHYYEPTTLWESAREEIAAVLGVLPILGSDWTLPWLPEVLATDASEEGYGCCLGRWDEADVSAAGRVAERGRFRR